MNFGIAAKFARSDFLDEVNISMLNIKQGED
jgi:hypothetical protein